MDIETMKAYEWALNQNFGSVAAQYAKKLALYIQSAKSATSEEVQRAIEDVRIDIRIIESNHGMSEKEYKSLNLAITALQAYQPWIPVSERLPDGDVASVLIYMKEGGVAEGQYYPSIDSWKQFRWSVEDSSVTHWKPLPEPPKGELSDEIHRD